MVDGTLKGLSSRLRSTDALQIGLLLSQQEATYNTNMYESLQTADASALHTLMNEGKSVDDAVMELFHQRYVLPAANDNNNNTSPVGGSYHADNYSSNKNVGSSNGLNQESYTTQSAEDVDAAQNYPVEVKMSSTKLCRLYLKYSFSSYFIRSQ